MKCLNLLFSNLFSVNLVNTFRYVDRLYPVGYLLQLIEIQGVKSHHKFPN